MAELSRFFNSMNGDRRYLAEEWARYFSMFLTNGVYHTDFIPTLGVTAGTGMSVNVGVGEALINGYMYENTTPKALTISTAEIATFRIDRIVVRLDRNQDVRAITTQVLKGNPSSTTPPLLTRNNYIYEISLAQVRVNQGVTSISQANITDERLNSDVCGRVRSLITDNAIIFRDDTTNTLFKFGTNNGLPYIEEV